MKTKRVLIGSPIHQKPKILEEFLLSLKQLKRDTSYVDYLFIDDNELKESSELLDSFLEEDNERVKIWKSEQIDPYHCTEKDHAWNDKLIQKVAHFKNRMIEKAKELAYDFLFLVDSDLVMNPNTLEQLISREKDIISEIFWTRWQPEIPELPQVWVADQYTLYHVKKGEELSDVEKAIRQFVFLQQLRKPGVYEVGGLGACTLISKKALEAGVNFNEIKNVSFIGEDRHFCIRAQVLGFSLYVDSHYPAYHIYRETDLNGVEEFRMNGNPSK